MNTRGFLEQGTPMKMNQSPELKNDGMNPYAAGKRIYSYGRSAPSVGANNKAGYVARDLKSEVRQNLISNLAKGKIMSGGNR